uniref:Aromatic-L-amino-acid decarboxylase n=1 Tax=Romanomermis culicivorax TaxID=13658 RepID=A0A915HFG8_ROMCU
MNSEEFRIWGKKMVDCVADYWSTIRERKPLPDLKPGYMKDLLPDRAPERGEQWENIFKDLESVVFSGVTHWHHPHFFSYYPTALSYPAIMGDILSGGLGCLGFTWLSSPAATELEMIVVDWVAEMIKLPSFFFNKDPGPGVGMIQSTASDCTLVAFMAARSKAQAEGKDTFKLVAYTSEYAHSSVERAALLENVIIRKIATDEKFQLRGESLASAIEKDLRDGLVPFLVCATLGTTSCCSFDNLSEIGSVCQKYGLYLHVDAAYAGSAFICQEYRHHLAGIELVDSFNFNAHKLLLVNFDCSLMWFKNGHQVEKAFLVDPIYLKHEHAGQVIDFKNLQIPLGRRFRALKLWFVLRHYGIEGLQAHVRSIFQHADEFSKLVGKDDRFEISAPVNLGLVCFRLKGENAKTENLLKLINEDRRIHLVPTHMKSIFVLRLAVCSTMTTSDDINFAWKVIKALADKIWYKN